MGESRERDGFFGKYTENTDVLLCNRGIALPVADRNPRWIGLAYFISLGGGKVNIRHALLGLCVLATQPVFAETLSGRVVSVTDGDTITVLDASNQQHKIRLSAIDTPEKAQPWGQKAKESLSDIVFNRQVTVDWEKLDRYKRTIGKVMVDGKDANLAQLKAGMAWHYKKYEKEQSEDDRILYAEAENIARMLKKGLWSDSDPVPPWEWRHPKSE